MQLVVTIGGQTAIGGPSGTAVLSPMGGLAPVMGFTLPGSEGLQYSPLYKGSRITKERRVSTARLNFLVDSSFSVTPLSRLVIEGGGARQLNGFVLSVRRRWMAPDQLGVEVEGADHHWLMSRFFLTKSYSAMSDQDIIIDIIASSGLSNYITATTSTVSEIEASLTLDFIALSARDALDKVCAITGGEWYVSQEDPPVIYYRAPGAAAAAAFNVSDNPDNSTTFEYMGLSHEEQHREPINDVRVLGGIVSSVRVDVTREDAASKTALAGMVFHKQHVDATILTTAIAELVGDNILERSAFPLVSCSFEVHRDGLEPDSEIEITSADFGLSAEPFVIQKVTMEQLTPSETIYRIECGDRFTELPDKLKGISAGIEQEQAAPDPDGSGAVSEYVSEFGSVNLVAGTATINLSSITDVKSASAYFHSSEPITAETFSTSFLSATSFSIDSSDGASTTKVSWSASGTS